MLQALIFNKVTISRTRDHRDSNTLFQDSSVEPAISFIENTEAAKKLAVEADNYG